MGMYNTYVGNGAEVQLKVGHCEDMLVYKIGDKTDIPNGVYLSREGIVVVQYGIVAAVLGNQLYSKWGDPIKVVDVLKPYDYVALAIEKEEKRHKEGI